MRKIFSSVLVSLLASGGVFSAALAPLPVKAATVNTAIKGSSSTVYWYASNGKRYVFPNANTYFTWFPSMATVQTVTDAELSNMPLAGSVTYRPGAKLVKIESDPKVYAVARYGVLRHVTTESLAASLYGSGWQSQIHDIPAVFFSNYTVGAPIVNTWDFNVSQEYNGVSTPSDNISGMTGSSSPASNGDAAITGLTLTSNYTSINSGETIRLTANATNSGAWSYVGNRIEIRDQRNGSIVRTCYDQSWCAPDVTVYRLNNETSVQYEARIYDRNGVLVRVTYSPIINLSGTTPGSGSTNTGNASVTGLALTTSHTSINAGDTIRLTANASNVGGYSYSGHRIEIVDARNGSIVRTCHDQSWCAPDVTVNRIGSETSVQFYAVLKNSAGMELSRGYSPVITLTGQASGQLTGSVDVYFAPRPAQPNSTVYVTASVTNANYPTTALTIRVFDGISGTPIGSCTGVVVCSVAYAIGSTVPNAYFTATVSTQDYNNKIQSPTVSLR